MAGTKTSTQKDTKARRKPIAKNTDRSTKWMTNKRLNEWLICLLGYMHNDNNFDKIGK